MKHKPSQLLLDLLQIESVESLPNNLQKVIDVAAAYISERGYTVERFESSGKPSMLAYHGKKRPKRFRVLFNGHLDVVPAKSSQFIPSLKGDKLFARGAHDMKAGAVGMIEVFCEKAATLGYPLGIQLVTDEEIGGFDGTGYQRSKGVNADYFIAGESTGFAVNTDAKGICWVKLHAQGTTAHGAYPWRGVNALHTLTQAVENIMKQYPVPKKEVWRTCVNLARIETNNTAFNKIPDAAVAHLDIRYTAGDVHFKNEKTATAFLRRHIGKSVSIEYVHWGPAHHTPEHAALVLDLVAARKGHARAQKHEKSHGASDARFYSDAQTQAVCFGPHGDGLHTDTEWVSMESVSTFKAILRDYLDNQAS
jgi:succinyl-diaminopimelate desuccinylase